MARANGERIVRIVGTPEGSARVEDVANNLATALKYLEERSREVGMEETANLIGVAVLSAQQARA